MSKSTWTKARLTKWIIAASSIVAFVATTGASLKWV